MDIWSDKRGNEAIIYVKGDIDEHTVPDIRDHADMLIEQGVSNLEFCLKYVDFMDSTGIGMLLGRFKKIRKSGGHITLSCVNSQIDKVFRLANIYSLIPLLG